MLQEYFVLCIPCICAYLTHSQLMPEVNSVWGPCSRRIHCFFHCQCFAVATPNGLITPIVSSADQRTIPEITTVLRVYEHYSRHTNGASKHVIPTISTDVLCPCTVIW